MREQHMIEQKARDRFLEEWIFGRYEANFPNEFEQRAQRLGVDVKSAKRILVFSVRTTNDEQIDDQTQTAISHRIRVYLLSLKQAFLFRTATLFISVLNYRNNEEILSIAREIESLITKNFGCKVFIGIDSSETKDVIQSFKNANAALQLSLKTGKNINIYDALNLDLFITRMPLKDRHDYLNHLFVNQTYDQIRPIVDLLKVFYKENGSIEKTSQSLFIHKNTLQYRLNKITQITAFDPRKLGSAHLFIVAIMVFDSMKNDFT
jgi:carbohydrate diacid regulator